MHDVDDLKHSSTHAHTHAHKGWRNCTLPARMCERLHAQRVYMATPCSRDTSMHMHAQIQRPMMSRGVLLTESVCVPRSETLLDSVVLV